jgi:hypothetical protein
MKELCREVFEMRAILTAVDGQKILVEVAEDPDVMEDRGNFAGEGVVDRLEEAADGIRAVCVKLHEKAYGALADRKPKKFTIEFGVTLGGEAGVPLVTKGTASATFKVTATWED